MFEFELKKIIRLGEITILNGISKDGSVYSGDITDNEKIITVSYGMSSNISEDIELKLVKGNVTEKDINKVFRKL